MKKRVRYLGCINLIGIHGAIRLRESDSGGWWDDTGEFGGSIPLGQSGGTTCTNFVSPDLLIVETWLHGARALAEHIKDTL